MLWKALINHKPYGAEQVRFMIKLEQILGCAKASCLWSNTEFMKTGPLGVALIELFINTQGSSICQIGHSCLKYPTPNTTQWVLYTPVPQMELIMKGKQFDHPYLLRFLVSKPPPVRLIPLCIPASKNGKDYDWVQSHGHLKIIINSETEDDCWHFTLTARIEIWNRKKKLVTKKRIAGKQSPPNNTH